MTRITRVARCTVRAVRLVLPALVVTLGACDRAELPLAPAAEAPPVMSEAVPFGGAETMSSTVSLVLQSGAQNVSGRDPSNQLVSCTGPACPAGALPQAAYRISRHGAWAASVGSSYIAAVSDGSTRPSPGYACCTTAVFENTFTLPAGVTSASISLRILADNQLTVSVNGTHVGGHPDNDEWSNFNGPSLFFSTTFTPDPSGTNTLKLTHYDGGGALGLSYHATITYTQPDVTPPILTSTVTGTLGNDDWFTSNVQVSWNATDPESQVTLSAGCATSTVTADTPGTTFTCTASSDGGSVTKHVTVKRDATAPTVGGEVSGTTGSAGWYTSPVTIAWTADGGVSGGASTSHCAAGHSGDTSGETVTCTVTDGAGNTASAEVSFKIDATAPSVSGAVSGTMGSGGWYTSPVSINWTADGGVSGGASTAHCSAGHSADTAGETVTCAVTDGAGNTASASVNVKIDQTAPTVTFSGSLSYTVDQQVSIACTAADALSGVASSSCAGVSGAAYTFAIGANTHTATVSDLAGNSHTGSVTFQVSVTQGSLCALVRQWVTQHGVANSMCQQLQNGAYGAFRNHVSAQTDKSVSAAHAAILLALVDEL